MAGTTITGALTAAEVVLTGPAGIRGVVDLDNLGVIHLEGDEAANVPPGGSISVGRTLRNFLRIRLEVERLCVRVAEVERLCAGVAEFGEKIDRMWFAPGMPGMWAAQETFERRRVSPARRRLQIRRRHSRGLRRHDLNRLHA